MRADFLGHCEATGKRMYESRAKANRIARLHHEHLDTYRCDACGCYHVGHLPKNVMRGRRTRTDLYAPVTHARPDDLAPEMQRLAELKAVRELLRTGQRHVRGIDRDEAVARINAEIQRMAETLIGA